MANRDEGRRPLKELLLWMALLGSDALVMYLIHRQFGQFYNYQDTMPVVLSVGAFAPLLAAVLRYIPKKGARIAGIVIALAMGVAIGQVALRGFYGDHPFIIEAIYGKNAEAFVPAEINGITGMLYEGGEPASGEIDLAGTLAWYTSTGQSNVINGIQDYRCMRGGAPEKRNWVELRFSCVDGRERKLLLFSDDKWDYIEEPGVGAWRRPSESTYLNWREACIDSEFEAAFKAPLAAGEKPFLSSDYNGGEKAVWIDWSQEAYNGELYMDTSWSRNSARNDNTSDYDTPEGYVPERAADVRWLFLKERTDHVYEGYWYDVRTGERVSSQYENSYRVAVYDLTTGEMQVLAESDNSQDGAENARALDIGTCMEAFFGETEDE